MDLLCSVFTHFHHQTQLCGFRRKRRSEKKNATFQMVPTVTHLRSGVSSFFKMASIPSFMKTVFFPLRLQP